MPNVENINKLIAALQADTGEHYRMDTFCQYIPGADPQLDAETLHPTRYVECKTTFCFAGWANLLRLEEAGLAPKEAIGNKFWLQFADEGLAAAWLGVDDANKAYDLFYMHGDGLTEFGYGFEQRDRFDALPADKRRAAGIRVLEILRDTGEVRWAQALTDVGIAFKKE